MTDGPVTADPFTDFDHYTRLCLDDDPVPLLRDLREHCPVGRTEARGGSWVLTRYQDVWEAARDTGGFSSADGVANPHHGMPSLPPIEVDPPMHTQIRGPLIPWFTPGVVGRNEGHAREVVTALIDEFIETGEADLAAQLTVPMPAIINTPVIGIPLADREKLQNWAISLMSSGGTDVEAITGAMGYFAELYEVRQREPRDDIPTKLTKLEVDGRRLDQQEFVLTMVMIMSGGLDTTTNTGSHMLLWLAEHPEQRRLLIEEPERIPAAVEELLRHITPLPSLFRTATRAMSLHDRKIAEGDRIQLCWMAANHDPAEFADPETVQLDRAPNRHFSFGVGPHRCLGAALARMELRVMLEEALPRLGDYRVTEPPLRYSAATRGISRLAVAFPPGPRVGS
jgi:cytochrome P450